MDTPFKGKLTDEEKKNSKIQALNTKIYNDKTEKNKTK
jgi:hypothetical protein